MSPRTPRSKSTTALTHLNASGEVHMVDVGAKDETQREAIAEGELHARADVLDALFGGTLGKGDALATARIAGIQAAKRTSDLIPLCHPIATTHASVQIEHDKRKSCARVTAIVRTTGRTGVEMEALTAASIALLALYDMAKALQKDMRIESLRLRRKTGGRSGDVKLA